LKKISDQQEKFKIDDEVCKKETKFENLKNLRRDSKMRAEWNQTIPASRAIE